MAILILFFALSGPAASASDESFPEFVTLSELEQARFDRPSLLGSEYQSDVYAFAKPHDWDYRWMAGGTAFDTSFGSISPVHFLMDTRAKLQAPLSPALEFRFLHFDERQHEREAVHTIFELITWPWKRFGLGIYGEPSFQKRENDLGLAVFWKAGETHELKAFHTWVDLVRQRRNERSDSFDRSRLPYAMGLVGRWWSEEARKSFVQYAVRHEPLSLWRFPDEQYSYSFWRDSASLKLSLWMSPYWRLNTKLQVDKKLEARSRSLPTSSAAEDSYVTTRHLASLQTPLSGLFPGKWELTPTIQYAHRRWSMPRDQLSYHDFLFGLLLGPPAWFFDYSLNWHRKEGGVLLDHPDEKTRSLEQRLDIGYAFLFHSRAELRIRAGFDLDSFGTKNSWEAGAAQFRWAL